MAAINPLLFFSLSPFCVGTVGLSALVVFGSRVLCV